MGKLYERNIRLDSPDRVRLLIARVINKLDEGEISVAEARAMGYLAGKLIDAFKTVELADRVEELEKLAEQSKGRWSA